MLQFYKRSCYSVGMILICFGTRPECIKLQPLLSALDTHIAYKTLFTGQHQDLINPSVDYHINILQSNQRLNTIIAACMTIPNHIFDGVSHVLVQGDTASALGVALCAFHRGIPIIHLEAGLRSHNLEHPYPEEGYRQCISRLASIHLCPTQTNADHLKNEGISSHVTVVGNTVLDHLVGLTPEYGNTVLVTMHRRENHATMHVWASAINAIAMQHPELEFIWPMHPNPNVSKHHHILSNVRVLQPLSHPDMIQAIRTCHCIISDSGGLQEEASFLNKKMIVCRRITERTESLHSHSFLCPHPTELAALFNMIHANPVVNAPCPYGDGHASAKILTYLKNTLIHPEPAPLIHS